MTYSRPRRSGHRHKRSYETNDWVQFCRTADISQFSCSTGKYGYATKSDAKRLLRRMRSQGDDPDTHVFEIYQCVSCEHWHLGHRRWAAT